MKHLIYQPLAFFLLIVFSPFLLLLYILVKTTSSGPFLFKQKRLGKNKRIFTMFKIRTMVDDAQAQQEKLRHLNEADGPVFKIRQDPRYTGVGKFLARTGLDELPQFINIVRGEMSFVGPRPLPVDEGQKIPKKYERRFSVLPGITSAWVVKGAHNLNFDQWMKLDFDYVNRNSFLEDLKIGTKTIFLMIKLLARKLVKLQ